MVILKALFLIFIIGVLTVGIAAWLLVNKVRSFSRKFTGQQGQASETSRPTGQRTTQTASGDTIVDTRHPDEVSKKIFGDDEGEYVEFEEK